EVLSDQRDVLGRSAPVSVLMPGLRGMPEDKMRQKAVEYARAALGTGRTFNKQAGKLTGIYKGEPADPDSVKFRTEFQGIPINVDRPKGFVMRGTDAAGKDWARRYKLDYGFIPKTLGGDGDGLDVFIGPNKSA